MRTLKLIIIAIVSLTMMIFFTHCKSSKDKKHKVIDKTDTKKISKKADKNTLNIVTFSIDPPAVDSLHAFDPDSYEVISQIFDPLVYYDYDGKIQPGLATSWKRINDKTIEFELREGVKFHNGEPFNAEAVKFTFETQLDPKTKSPTSGILSSIDKVEIIDPHKVRIITKFPDGMLLSRMHMFGSIIPPKYVKEKGLDGFAKHPVGTGPFCFEKWERGKKIVLKKNANYWKTGFPKMDKVVFNIIPENNWFKALLKGEVDFVMYLSGKHADQIKKNKNTKIMKRLVLSSYWVLIKGKGPLADKRVRQAMNHAIDRQALIQYADYGNGEVIAAMSKKGEFGYNPTLQPYKYDLAKAKKLMKAANYENGFKIKVLVSDICHRVAEVMKENLKKLNIELDLQIVPRPEWAMKIPQAKMTTGKVDFDGDMTINLVDNPIHNFGFHAYIFLHSAGPFSITNDKGLDNKIIWAISTSDPKEHEERLKKLDKYIYDNAFIISTYQRVLTPGMQKNVNMKKINLNAHLDYNMLLEVTKH